MFRRFLLLCAPREKDVISLQNPEARAILAIKDKMDAISYFTFRGQIFYAFPCNIYDGDTFSIFFLFRGHMMKYRVRMLGYDSPEMKPSLKKENRLQEKELAIQARNRLIFLLGRHPHGMIRIECGDFDKYGRILGKVWNMVDEKTVNEIMMEEGHGKPYDGGKKEEW